MKKILMSTFLVFSTLFVSAAGGGNDKIFSAFGYSVYTDYYGGMVIPFDAAISVYNSNTSSSTITTQKVYLKKNFLSMATFAYRFRYNVAESSDNLAYSLSASPALGLGGSTSSTRSSSLGISVDRSEFGLVFNMPILFNIEFGAGATYNTSSNVGGFFGAGIEITKFFETEETYYDDNNQKGVVPSVGVVVLPTLSAGIRYWNKSNRLREIQLKYGFGFGQDYKETPTSTLEQVAPMSIRLAFVTFLNY